MANALIPSNLRTGRILDIGCGSFPYFLAHTAFREKYAVEQVLLPGQVVSNLKIEFYNLNLNEKPHLPFEADFFSIVTLLAVVEHLHPGSMALLLCDVHRVLHSGGQVILTTPAAWSDGLLRLMARVNLVSAAEIDEHVYAYTLPLIGWYFGQAGFAMDKIKFGTFELGMNLWAVAEK
jgi:SAM-dependent methyltransferase